MQHSEWIPERVAADNRSIAAYFPGGKLMALLDFAHLRSVTLILLEDQLYWQLDGTDFAVTLIPFGIDGESSMRRELQSLPGFDTNLLFSYLDDRSDEQPPLTLWTF